MLSQPHSDHEYQSASGVCGTLTVNGFISGIQSLLKPADDKRMFSLQSTTTLIALNWTLVRS
jgi:hypothetical protein